MVIIDKILGINVMPPDELVYQQVIKTMSDQTFVKIIIEADDQYNQEGVNLKIELEEETLIEELLDYLEEEGKLRIPKDKLEVDCAGKIINFNLTINDCSQQQKVELQIRAKEEQFVQPYGVKEPAYNEIKQSIFDIPATGSVAFLPPTGDAKPTPQAPSAPSVPPPKKMQQEKLQQPAASSKEADNKTLTLLITVEDGDDRRGFEFPAAPQKCFNDIKPEIHEYIIKSKLMDNWSLQEEVKLYRGGKIFQKEKHAFQKLGTAQKTEFVMVRMFPGGAK